MKKVVVLIMSLILCLSAFGCGSSDQSVMEKYAEELGLKDSWVATMEEYIPNIDTLQKIENEGTSAYEVTLENGDSYYVVIGATGEVACIMTTESDYESRTRLYEAQ